MTYTYHRKLYITPTVINTLLVSIGNAPPKEVALGTVY